MPMVDTGLGDLAQQAMQLAEIMRRTKMQQGQNALNLAQPGQTVSQLLDPKVARLVLGKNYNPNQVVKERTIDTETEKAGVAYLDMVRSHPELLDQAQPGDIVTIGASAVANKLGTPGISTPGSIKSKASAATSKAAAEATSSKTVLDLVNEGAQAFKTAKPSTRAAMGQKLATGSTATEMENSELAAQLQIEMTKEGIKFAANPNAHAWGKQMRQLGIDPTAAMAAAGTGMMSLLGQIGQMAVDQAQGRIQMAVASANRQTEIMASAMKVDNEWADRVSQSLGGKLPPSVILGVMRGQAPPKGAEKQWEAASGLINQATEMTYRVALTDAAMKGNPAVGGLQRLYDVAKGVKDTKAAEAMSKEIRMQTGQVIAMQNLGPRPELQGNEDKAQQTMIQRAQAAWDAAAAKYGDLAPKEPSWYEKFFSSFRQTRQNNMNPPGQVQGIPQSAIPQQPLGVPAARQDTQPKPTAGGPQSINDLSDEDKQALSLFMQVLGGGGQ